MSETVVNTFEIVEVDHNYADCQAQKRGGEPLSRSSLVGSGDCLNHGTRTKFCVASAVVMSLLTDWVE